MLPSVSEIEELETFFNNHPLPKKFKLNQAITILDLPEFIRFNIENLKKGQMAETVAKPRYDDLILIKKVLSEDI